MRRVYGDEDHTENTLSCDACGWRGTIDRANVLDFYGVSKIKEIHCPSCEALIGSINVESGDDFHPI